MDNTELCSKVTPQTQGSENQCHGSEWATVAPEPCSETLEHLENPPVSDWQPGWETVSDLSDAQMCGLLAGRGDEAEITH